MYFHDKSVDFTAKNFGTNIKWGLSKKTLDFNSNKFGYNVLTKNKKKGFFASVLDALKEPTLIILLFSFVIALGSSVGSVLAGEKADYGECLGILFAILLSVSITLIMEKSSQKAFDALNRIYDNVTVRVIREGEIVRINQKYVAVGDVILLESGEKIVADGRLIESSALAVDESALTGESDNAQKDSGLILNEKIPLAERKNCVYSGTFVVSGSGKMIVTAIGDNTEIGKIAKEISVDSKEQSPLQYKLSKLSKIIAITGFIFAGLIFALSAFKLVMERNLNFDTARELFISCIVLIVAVVPEGLPTIVAISLALNMIKLSKENALIKKMTATETAGAISVICSDKTGTLTQNKMKVDEICTGEYCEKAENLKNEILLQNFVINSTATAGYKNKKLSLIGSATETALLEAVSKSRKNFSFKAYRDNHEICYVKPFSSKDKYMLTVIKSEKGERVLLKGAPELIVEKCNLTSAQKTKILSLIEKRQEDAKRVIAFAHQDVKKFDANQEINYVFDGFASLLDPLRPEVLDAVKDCKIAGIKIKMLTGDNLVTARAIAKKLKIIDSDSQVITADKLENLSDDAFLKAVLKVRVIARSTPIIKLRVVKALKSANEVVAVTGDGINDAPAIKHADVGIAMGVSGSEITKESADVILLDDSFATVVKTVAFGRNVFLNLKRFIFFQLSVNVSALLFITTCTLLGLKSPFNTLGLLWINLIMDGPPALTLGLEKCSKKLMEYKPVDRKESIVSFKTLLRILLSGIFIAFIMLMQFLFNFLKVGTFENKTVVFTLFILFQLFNAFNSRAIGLESIFSLKQKNRVMVYAFIGVFILHVLIVNFGYKLFQITPMSLSSWIKCLILSPSIILVSEIYKLIARKIKYLKQN